MYKVECCKEMKKEIKDASMFEVMDVIPFSGAIYKDPIKQKPTLYVSSDGGHGGMCKIKYCPFCGTEIKITGDK